MKKLKCQPSVLGAYPAALFLSRRSPHQEETSIQFRGFNTKIVVKKACEFFVYKDGEQVLKILTGSSDNRPVWLPILIKNAFFNGQLYYRDYDITLTYDKDSSHSRTIDLTYNRVGDKYPLLTMSAKLEDDADLWKIIRHDVNVRADFTVTAMKILSFEGVTNNVNYLVVNGVQIAKCMKEGTTKQDCEQLVESFNANLTLNLLLDGASVGQFYMGTQYDAVNDLYFPVVMIRSDLLGGKDYPAATILQIIGVDIPDILRTAAQN